MKIECPQCGFSRDISPDKLPSQSVVATCPKCGCKFHFSVQARAEKLPPEANSGAEEEEDIRAKANDAYLREYNKFKTPEPEKVPDKAGNPWQNAPGQQGWIAAFYQTVTQVMFSAPAFFKNLRTQCPQTRPLVFYVIIAVFQTLVERFWSECLVAMLSSTATDPQLEKLLAVAVPADNVVYILILRCGLLILQLYLFTFLLYIIYRVMAPKRATFSLIFQIMTYSSAPSVLCIVPVLGSLIGTLWGIGCLAVGCKAALDLSWDRVLLGFLPIIFFLLPFFYHLYSSMRIF